MCSVFITSFLPVCRMRRQHTMCLAYFVSSKHIPQMKVVSVMLMVQKSFRVKWHTHLGRGYWAGHCFMHIPLWHTNRQAQQLAPWQVRLLFSCKVTCCVTAYTMPKLQTTQEKVSPSDIPDRQCTSGDSHCCWLQSLSGLGLINRAK